MWHQVTCKNKSEGKQKAAQAILAKLHPQIKTWGPLLRMYGPGSCETPKEKKEEEQQITELQSSATPNKPNYAILNKLKEEMNKIRDKRVCCFVSHAPLNYYTFIHLLITGWKWSGITSSTPGSSCWSLMVFSFRMCWSPIDTSIMPETIIPKPPSKWWKNKLDKKVTHKNDLMYHKARVQILLHSRLRCVTQSVSIGVIQVASCYIMWWSLVRWKYDVRWWWGDEWILMKRWQKMKWLMVLNLTHASGIGTDGKFEVHIKCHLWLESESCPL